MARAFLSLAGLSWVVAAGTGCAGETFTTTEGTGGMTTTTTGDPGGAGGAGGATTTTTTTGTGGAGGGTGGVGGAGGSGGQGGGGPACQPLSDVCTQCAYGACEDLYCACYGSDACPALVNCLSPCDPADMACVQPCLTMYEGSISTAFLLGDCAAAPCDGVCMGVATQQPCPKCLFEKCPAQMNACLADPACYEILQCAVACPPNDFVCALACTNGQPTESTNKAVAVQGCTTSAEQCQTECSGG